MSGPTARRLWSTCPAHGSTRRLPVVRTSSRSTTGSWPSSSAARSVSRRTGGAQLLDGGARSVIVTRAAEPAYAVRADGEEFELVPPRFDRGAQEGCGDAMTGARAAGWALGLEWLDVLILGTAAGSANFLRHGLGTGSKAVVDELVGQVHVRSAQA